MRILNRMLIYKPRLFTLQQLGTARDQLRTDARAQLAPLTLASYGSDWNVFSAFCRGADLESLPATSETVSLYAVHLLSVGRKITTALRHLSSIGLDPRRYAGHTLRTSFISEAFDKRVPEAVIMRHTGHRSASSLRLYLRPSDPFRANAAAQIGM